MTAPTDRDALVKLLRDVKAALETHYMGLPKDVYPGPPTEIVMRIGAALTAQGGEQTADTVSVPREPTEAMINAFCSEWLKPVRGDRIHRIYKAMLTAAKEGKS